MIEYVIVIWSITSGYITRVVRFLVINIFDQFPLYGSFRRLPHRGQVGLIAHAGLWICFFSLLRQTSKILTCWIGRCSERPSCLHLFAFYYTSQSNGFMVGLLQTLNPLYLQSVIQHPYVSLGFLLIWTWCHVQCQVVCFPIAIKQLIVPPLLHLVLPWFLFLNYICRRQ